MKFKHIDNIQLSSALFKSYQYGLKWLTKAPSLLYDAVYDKENLNKHFVLFNGCSVTKDTYDQLEFKCYNRN